LALPAAVGRAAGRVALPGGPQRHRWNIGVAGAAPMFHRCGGSCCRAARA